MGSGLSFCTARSAGSRPPSSTCNALGHCTERSFDAETGNVLTQKDPNGLITSYSYDAFGRSAGSTFAQQDKYLASTTRRVWCTDQAQACFNETLGLYAIETETSTGR